MPKASTFSRAVESAAKCCPALPPPTFVSTHARAESALAIVSCVVKVLEAIRKSVRRGSSPFSVSARCAPSTFETKCVRGPS